MSTPMLYGNMLLEDKKNGLKRKPKEKKAEKKFSPWTKMKGSKNGS